jgi:hypothetical protein
LRYRKLLYRNSFYGGRTNHPKENLMRTSIILAVVILGVVGIACGAAHAEERSATASASAA